MAKLNTAVYSTVYPEKGELGISKCQIKYRRISNQRSRHFSPNSSNIPHFAKGFLV